MNVIAFALDQHPNQPNHMWGISFFNGQLLMGTIAATNQEDLYILNTRDGLVYFAANQVAYIKA